MSFKYNFVTVDTDLQWKEYHHIRRDELFDNSPSYQEDHEDEFKPENTPMLMLMDNNPVATVRLDRHEDDKLIIRLVAVKK